MSDTILVERDDTIATVTLNRPEKLNALTKPMWKRLGEVMDELGADDGIRCIVVRGAGEKSFSPGNDISEFEHERANPEQSRAYGAIIASTMDSVQYCRHPTVALINGICVGGGLEIAGLCDLRICGESSRFGAPINRLGLVMAYRELQALVTAAGRDGALEILLEGRVFGAEEALRKGMVTRVVPDAEVATEAYETAARIAAGAPLVARWHKKFLRRLQDPTPISEEELDECYECFGTEDYDIGYHSFLVKKKPEFKGR